MAPFNPLSDDFKVSIWCCHYADEVDYLLALLRTSTGSRDHRQVVADSRCKVLYIPRPPTESSVLRAVIFAFRRETRTWVCNSVCITGRPDWIDRSTTTHHAGSGHERRGLVGVRSFEMFNTDRFILRDHRRSILCLHILKRVAAVQSSRLLFIIISSSAMVN